MARRPIRKETDPDRYLYRQGQSAVVVYHGTAQLARFAKACWESGSNMSVALRAFIDRTVKDGKPDLA